MGNLEVAQFLGVAKQRVHQIRMTALWRKHVPNVRQLRMGPVFLADEVRAFREAWTRQPGRPRGDLHADVP